MTLERLDWILYKQRHIVNQIKTVKEKTDGGKPIEQIGYIPEYFSPQDLINFHKDRYNILEIAKNYDEKRLQKWLQEARNRLSEECNIDEHKDCEKCFTTRTEMALLKGCING